MTSSVTTNHHRADLKRILQDTFHEVFFQPEYDENSAHRYFDPKFRQSVDGKELDCESFLRHLKAVKNVIREMSIEYKTIVLEGDVVFSNHVVHAIGHDGRMSETHVIAEFRFLEGKIVGCDELTRTLNADSAHSDLGWMQ